MGYSGLAAAIQTKFGGFRRIKKIMDYNQKRKPNGYFDNWKNFEKEFRDVVEKEFCDSDGNVIKGKGVIPSRSKLRAIGMSSLDAAIDNHGGKYCVFKKMGYAGTRKPPNFWKDFTNVDAMLRPETDRFLKENEHLPEYDDLINIGLRGLLLGVVKYHGALKAVYERMGYGRYLNGKIDTPQKLKNVFDNEEAMRIVASRFDPEDAADIMAVMYSSRVTREMLMELMDDSSLRAYLGPIKNPITDINDAIEVGTHILHLDKGGVIRDLLFRKMQEIRREKLGANPTQEQREEYLKGRERELNGLEAVSHV
jgi:hypothetical protein